MPMKIKVPGRSRSVENKDMSSLDKDLKERTSLKKEDALETVLRGG